MASARILVVEDERGIQVALGALLRKEGYEVVLAGSGEEALVELTRAPFDLVLTDIALGGAATGMDVLRASKETRREVPVVLITAHGNERIAVDALKQGADDYVPKPFENEEIRLLVRGALDRTRVVRQSLQQTLKEVE